MDSISVAWPAAADGLAAEKFPSGTAVLTFCASFFVPTEKLLRPPADIFAFPSELGRLWADAHRALEGLALPETNFDLAEALQGEVGDALRVFFKLFARLPLGPQVRQELLATVQVAYFAGRRSRWCGIRAR